MNPDPLLRAMETVYRYSRTLSYLMVTMIAVSVSALNHFTI